MARQGILRRLSQKGIEIIRLVEPVLGDGFEEGVIEYEQVYSGARGSISQVSLLAYATPRAPEARELHARLDAAGVRVRRIGDCRSPRDLMMATAEGHAAGMAV